MFDNANDFDMTPVPHRTYVEKLEENLKFL